jgi:hypothetical protein
LETSRPDRGASIPSAEADKRWLPSPIAWRQYEVKLASGATATLGFSLADRRDANNARVMKAYGASQLGLFVVLGDPQSREAAVLWFQQARFLTLFSPDPMKIGDEVKGLLPRYFTAFFDDIKDLAPDLASVKLIAPRTGDRNLH